MVLSFYRTVRKQTNKNGKSLLTFDKAASNTLCVGPETYRSARKAPRLHQVKPRQESFYQRPYSDSEGNTRIQQYRPP